MSSLRSWRAFGLAPGQTWVLVGAALAHGGLGFIPLFGGPGYEAALALGVLLPLPVACLSALRARSATGVQRSPPLALLGAAVRFAVVVIAVQLLVLLLHGARVGFCDPREGVILFLLGPALGVVMAATWGTLAGLASRAVPGERARAALALALAAAGPVGSVLVSAWRFWSSPMVFAFDPFVGFFAGTLYDTVIDAVPRLITYRAGSAGSLLAVVCVCAALGSPPVRGASASPGAGRRGVLALAVLGAAISLGVIGYGPELGHYQTAATIRAALGQARRSARCEIVYAAGILPERIEALGRECDAHVAAHEAYFETSVTAPITVFAFLSAAQKGHLMGASNTYIAKPWRWEVYVQSDNYPHPVLSHELAHVVAGTFGRGPLRVAGPWGGWIPDPGRIEGFAVAAAPPDDTDSTLLEWTKALSDLGLLPPLRSIFRLSFLGQNSSTGYTVAGAVVDWLRARHGPGALRAWYSGASIESAFGEPLDSLERAFKADLARIQIPERVMDQARARFDRPAIFGRRCPHVVDQLLERASYAFESFDLATAGASYAGSLALDPSNFNARFGLGACAERRGAEPDALALYAAMLQDPSLTRVQRASVLERLGDRALLSGQDAAAEGYYADAERHAFDEHRARTVSVKRYALRHADSRSAIAALLIGDARLGSDLALAMAALGEWATRDPALGLADYLIGKNLYNRSRWREAYLRLQAALQKNLPIDSVRREALRTLVFAACALDEDQVAQAAVRDYLADPGLSSARKIGMQRFAKSCRLDAAP